LSADAVEEFSASSYGAHKLMRSVFVATVFLKRTARQRANALRAI
jgi:hypothetical protein